jgi:TRAP-type C4-dicarboxylate transport system substrate-binding protein
MVFGCFLFINLVSVYAQKYTIKFATLAPEGSTWMNVMREYDKEIREQTNGDVGFKIYGGGILGDEMDVLRKIRIGQVHAGGFTGVGLGEIYPPVRILEAPFLLKNYDEVDLVYEKFGDELAQGLAEKGYELLGWSEVGFVYVFSKESIATLEELKKTKMWVWQGDQLAETTFKTFGLKPVPLSVLDVMTALQTNMVDGFYVSPLGAIALQWFTRVKYMLDIPLTDGSGAVLISKKMFDKIPEEYQMILKKLGKKYLQKLTHLSREDNETSIETLKENGIKVSSAQDAATLAIYNEVGAQARRELVGKFYSQDLLDRFESALNTFREKNQN